MVTFPNEHYLCAMFESLNERLESALKTIKGEARLTELNIAESIKEIRRALVEADVNYRIAKDFTDKNKLIIFCYSVPTKVYTS